MLGFTRDCERVFQAGREGEVSASTKIDLVFSGRGVACNRVGGESGGAQPKREIWEIIGGGNKERAD